ncbi:MAG: transposase [Alteromonadaceae bacterium]|nr:transposase [Alteromonadaceae bacterium]
MVQVTTAQESLKKRKKALIKRHYLPPYSPNLNPIERLWKVMNEHARNRNSMLFLLKPYQK